jgi:carbamoyl-phosphate synthase small subunit
MAGTKVDEAEALRQAKAFPGLKGMDLAKVVSCTQPYEWHEGSWQLETDASPSVKGGRFHVVAYDYGIKRNILRHLAQIGARVTVVPADTSAADTLALGPDGVFLSNGPGDPEPLEQQSREVKKLIGKVPVFGICLGHQILGLALGGRTYKLKFGHHGANHPVLNRKTNKVEITSQNHGFCVDPDSLRTSDIEITHVNLNDQTVEGLQHRSEPVFCVQYHPEAAPGPHDSHYLFHQFAQAMKERKS